MLTSAASLSIDVLYPLFFNFDPFGATFTIMYVLTVYILLVNKLIYKDQAYSNAQLSTQINASPTQARLEPPYIRHKSIQTNTSATRINTSLKGLNTSHFGSLLRLFIRIRIRIKREPKANSTNIETDTRFS